MKIVVLGGGAMGALFGGYLSRSAEVTIVDVNTALVDAIARQGISIHEPDGSVTVCHPGCVADTAGMGPVDLILVFVKSMFSHSALEANRHLIGPDTYLLTLQNGSGHEDTLLEFADSAHVLIGTTQHNSAVGELGSISHGGSGHTYLGCLEGDPARLQPFADVFTAGGLEASVSDGVQKLIWNKMFTNVSASVLTGALQVPMGFITSDPDAWAMCQQLIREAVDVAAGEGLDFDYDQKVAEVKAVCDNSPKGLTSIYADLRDGRRSEVDTISGSVVRASRRNGVPAPSHEFIVHLIHAMEAKQH
jgi:2-dehydropantoate 2-reductase